MSDSDQAGEKFVARHRNEYTYLIEQKNQKKSFSSQSWSLLIINTMESLDHAVIICPLLQRGHTAKIIVEVLDIQDIHIVDFEVNGDRWGSFVHSAHYSTFRGLPLEKSGWYRVHYTYLDDTLDLRLCICEQGRHERECSKSWEHGMYMTKVIDMYCRHWEQYRSFPAPQEVRSELQVFVQMVKSSRNFVSTESEKLQDEMYEFVGEIWNQKIQEFAEKAKGYGMIPFSSSCLEEIGEQWREEYMISDECNTSQLTASLEQVDKMFRLIMVHCERSSYWLWDDRDLRNFSRDLVKGLGSSWNHLTLKTIESMFGARASTVGHFCSSRLTNILHGIFKKMLEKKVRMFMMSLPIRLTRWRWTAVRNQNHPLVLKKRGVFEQPFV
jgi:hypothetical protein